MGTADGGSHLFLSGFLPVQCHLTSQFNNSHTLSRRSPPKRTRNNRLFSLRSLCVVPFLLYSLLLLSILQAPASLPNQQPRSDCADFSAHDVRPPMCHKNHLPIPTRIVKILELFIIEMQRPAFYFQYAVRWRWIH